MTESLDQVKPIEGQKDLKKKLALVIPTFNERENIKTLIERIEATSLPFQVHIVIVDDNSPDGTASAVRDVMGKWNNILLLERPKPMGLGSAYMEGFSYSLEKTGCDFLGEMDADLQHPPEVLKSMCQVANEGADVVIASRYIRGGGSHNWPLLRRLVSKGANLLTRIFLRVPAADATSGYRVISSKLVEGLLKTNVSSKGYSFQVESLYVYKKLGARFAEVPFEFESRKSGETKLGWKEIFRFAARVIWTGIRGVRTRETIKRRGSRDETRQ